MKIGLIDVDGHNFPNLALMKISAYHKQNGDEVEWCVPIAVYDRVYASRVFDNTYSKDIPFLPQAKEIIYGGTGYGLKNKLPDDIEHFYPDYALYPEYENTALGFLTRGCPNNCPFCVVSEKEGRRSVKVAELNEFWRGQKEIKLLDPNLLACKDHMGLLEQLAASGSRVDFTQGLDARLITERNAAALARLKIKTVHFAFDLTQNEERIVKGLKTYKEIVKTDSRKAGVYILTNFNTTLEEDLYRIRVVDKLGYSPYVMIYDKPNAPKIIRYLQGWCNNRIAYAVSNKDFWEYKPRHRQTAMTVREIMGGTEV